MELSQHLAELLTLEDDDALFVTAYLDTSVGPVGVRTFPIFLRKRTSIQERLVLHRGGDVAVREFRRNVSRMEEYLTYKLAPDTRGCALFSSVGRDFLKAIQLPVRLANKLSVAKAPNLEPLIELQQKSRHYAVVTLDQHSGRIFSIFLQGEAEGPVPVDQQIEQTPRRSSGGGWSQMRHQRNRLDKIEHFMRNFGERLTAFLQRERVAGVLLLGTPENVAEFVKHLPAETQNQVLLTSNSPSLDQEDEILERSLKLIEEFEREREGELIDKLYDRLSQDFQAVVGIEETLYQLQIGRVARLFIGPSFQSEGHCCGNCGFCFSGSEETCTYCQGDLTRVELRQQLEILAAQKQVPFEVVADVTFLDSLGGTGAFLRF